MYRRFAILIIAIQISLKEVIFLFVFDTSVKESSEWPAVGILAGSPYHLGDYPECLKSRGPGVQPKYCIVTGYFQRKRATVVTYSAIASSNSIWLDWPKENISAWDVVDEVKLYT